MDGDEENPGFPVEHVHGAVPGVYVRVEDHHPVKAVILQQVLGADRNVVEDAEPPAVASTRMVEASPHPLGDPHATVDNQLSRPDRTPHDEPRRVDYAGPQRRVPR